MRTLLISAGFGIAALFAYEAYQLQRQQVAHSLGRKAAGERVHQVEMLRATVTGATAGDASAAALSADERNSVTEMMASPELAERLEAGWSERLSESKPLPFGSHLKDDGAAIADAYRLGVKAAQLRVAYKEQMRSQFLGFGAPIYTVRSLSSAEEKRFETYKASPNLNVVLDTGWQDQMRVKPYVPSGQVYF